jgi:hypothetical protein
MTQEPGILAQIQRGVRTVRHSAPEAGRGMTHRRSIVPDRSGRLVGPLCREGSLTGRPRPRCASRIGTSRRCLRLQSAVAWILATVERMVAAAANFLERFPTRRLVDAERAGTHPPRFLLGNGPARLAGSFLCPGAHAPRYGSRRPPAARSLRPSAPAERRTVCGSAALMSDESPRHRECRFKAHPDFPAPNRTSAVSLARQNFPGSARRFA